MTRRLEELELKKMHEVQAVAETPVQGNVWRTSKCYWTIQAQQQCFVWKYLQLKLEEHPNFSWKPRAPQYTTAQPSQQASSLEQAIVNLSKVVGDFVGDQKSINAQLSQRIDSVENTLNKRMDGMQNDLSQKIDNLQYSISRLTNLNTVQEKGRFPSQPHQNPKGIHEVETHEGESHRLERIEEILPLFNKEGAQEAAKEETSQLNLKPLPTELKYTYLEENQQCPVVISSSLTSPQEKCLLEVLKRYILPFMDSNTKSLSLMQLAMARASHLAFTIQENPTFKSPPKGLQEACKMAAKFRKLKVSISQPKVDFAACEIGLQLAYGERRGALPEALFRYLRDSFLALIISLWPLFCTLKRRSIGRSCSKRMPFHFCSQGCYVRSWSTWDIHPSLSLSADICLEIFTLEKYMSMTAYGVELGAPARLEHPEIPYPEQREEAQLIEIPVDMRAPAPRVSSIWHIPEVTPSTPPATPGTPPVIPSKSESSPPPESRISISISEFRGLCHTLQTLTTSQSILTQQMTALCAYQEQIIATQTHHTAILRQIQHHLGIPIPLEPTDPS
ncbi:hypothetical protein CK203_115413 [Vitis vinifera]|uniref:Uncharacterized protein n=1 Tax=Vitis vinifera TaxID=29760 RepID=A0A438BSN3_VITVI|nr:hypothetical protein CK203_115413 [Vitis vinifera]